MEIGYLGVAIVCELSGCVENSLGLNDPTWLIANDEVNIVTCKLTGVYSTLCHSWYTSQNIASVGIFWNDPGNATGPDTSFSWNNITQHYSNITQRSTGNLVMTTFTTCQVGQQQYDNFVWLCFWTLQSVNNGFRRKSVYPLRHYNHIKGTSAIDCWYGLVGLGNAEAFE